MPTTASQNTTLVIDEISALYGQKAQDVFTAVAHLPWSILLDTCDNRLSDGRFDIIAYAPLATYQFKAGKSILRKRTDASHPLHDVFDDIALSHAPFADLAMLHGRFQQRIKLDNTHALNSELPFLAGALGLFGYDINTHTDKIRDDAPDQYQSDDIAVGFYEQCLIFDNRNKRVFHAHIQSIDETWIKQLVENLGNNAPLQADAPFVLLENWQSNMNEFEYQLSMTKIDAYLKSGDCYQVNFAQRFHALYAGSEWEAYRLLSRVNKAPFSAYIRLPDSCILSVSPERFLSLKNNKVSTKPIKGTRKRSKDAERDAALATELINSEKDRAENLMIVDLLRNDISKHCKPHSVQVPHLFALESYPAVHHLVSTVIGELKHDSSPFDLLAGAFPGGSITGAPKVRAMQIIQELEPDKRNIYCGSIGYVGIRNDMDTNICIRTVLAEQGIMYCWAGGGIVLDSEAKDEYQESFHKVAKILPVLYEHSLGVKDDSKHEYHANSACQASEKHDLEKSVSQDNTLARGWNERV